MFEVVEFRVCDCDWEDCPGEKETVHIQHESEAWCRDWILRYSLEFHGTYHFKTDKNRIDIMGMLNNGREFRRKFRVQEQSSTQSHGNKNTGHLRDITGHSHKTSTKNTRIKSGEDASGLASGS